jgi:hypothetical protein
MFIQNKKYKFKKKKFFCTKFQVNKIFLQINNKISKGNYENNYRK